MLCALLLGGALVGAPPSAPASWEPSQDVDGSGDTSREDPLQRVAARGQAGLVVRAADLERLLLERFAYVQEGRELFDLLFKTRLIDALATENEVLVSSRAVAARWEELDRRARAAGAGGILLQIQESELSIEEFREYLRLSILQEELTRKALGLGAKAEVTADQQELWLSDEIQERGVEKHPPPFERGLIARCGDVTIRAEEYSRFLHARLSHEKVLESAWHLLLLQALERKMPDLSAEARARAVEAEIERRERIQTARNPGLSFQQILGARGQTMGSLRNDPSVAIAALTRSWVDRKYGERGLRETYEKEREFFEGRFGRAVQTSALMLVAGQFSNELVPRTFEQAERELEELKERAGDFADFRALVARFTEDPAGREKEGLIGWVTRGDPRVPELLRVAVFDYLDTGGEVPVGGVILGPLRMKTGCCLLWLSKVRDSPAWEVMMEKVHEELRRRLVEELMPRQAVSLEERPGRSKR